MAVTSKRFNWQISFGVTHQLEYAELIEFYNKLPKMQQGAIGRRLMKAGLQALKKDGDPVVLSILNQHVNTEENCQDNQKLLVKSEKKLNKKVLELLDI